MSTRKLAAKLSKFLPAGAMGGSSTRAFVTAAGALQAMEFVALEKEKVKTMSDKVSETADVVKEKAAELFSLGAAKIATEFVKKKNEMKKEGNKNKK
ncbi:hypothetical protein QQP08_014380 [Theobroma cacao]|nr:hypothetical protein QQP08_014380 [Theobroma cacao]